MEKPLVVKVNRFTRFYQPFGDIDPRSGVSYSFEIDYGKREIRFGYSVCNGDNFVKKVGTQFATKRLHDDPIVVPLPDDGIPECGLVYYVIQQCRKMFGDSKQIRKFFREVRSDV